MRESMAKSSTTAAATTHNLPQAELFFILSKDNPVEERTRKVQELLERQDSRGFREELSRRVLQFVPSEALVPEAYKQWRPLVHDCMFFMMSRLSAPRLAPKLIEQLDLPAETKPEDRLLRLIAKVPGLQKLGQMLARNRNLPPALRRALTRLENGIRDVSAAEIQATIREQLGKKLEEYAVQVRPSIFVEASVSAVVRFTWKNAEAGRRERGVFKVLKPYISEFFSEDMDLLAQLAKHLGTRHRKYGFKPHVLPDMFNDIRLLLQHEVEFPREQATLKKVAKLYRAVPGISVPRVIDPLCTATITALTEERGRKITDAVARMPAWRRGKIAEQLIDAVIAIPLFSPEPDVLFHADPHAGNLLYDSRTSELVLLDWALTENLRLEQRRNLAMLFLMVVLRDPVGASDAIIALSPSGGRHEATKAKRIREEVNRYLSELPVKRIPRAVDAMGLLQIVAWEGIRLPRSLLMFRKALFTLDGILYDMAAPDFSVQSVMLRHLMKTWTAASKNIGAPLSLGDWVQVQCSALLFPGRLGLQGLQTMLERSPKTATPVTP